MRPQLKITLKQKQEWRLQPKSQTATEATSIDEGLGVRGMKEKNKF